MTAPVFNIAEIDHGFCRILYETKITDENGKTSKFYYCIQEDYKNSCNLYRCSLGPYYEPQNKATVKKGSYIIMEEPEGDSDLEKAVRNYMDKNKESIMKVGKTVKIEKV